MHISCMADLRLWLGRSSLEGRGRLVIGEVLCWLNHLAITSLQLHQTRYKKEKGDRWRGGGEWEWEREVIKDIFRR